MDDKKSNSLGILQPTSDGSLTLVHHQHGETYHSELGAKTEAQELYIGRSGIIDSLLSGESLRVLDVGLGLGYNAISTVAAWLNAPGPGDLFVLSLEINLDLIRHLTSTRAGWQCNWPDQWLSICRSIQNDGECRWSASLKHPSSDSELNWQILGGDALSFEWINPSLSGQFNFIWQDAFSPKTCPEMWQENWFKALRSVTAPDGIMMTYSVARVVRDQMKLAGWNAQRIAGSGKKKHWLRAINTSEISNASD